METIKQRLARGQLVRALGVGRVLHHNLVQITGIHGHYHCLWYDLEHVGNSIENLEVALLAARAHGLDTFVRIAPTDYAIVTRCLEAGASGVMTAQITSAAQAEEMVQWLKFHPRGRRGLNTGGFDAGYTKLTIPQFFEKSNRESFLAIQIETLGALEECDAIAAIDGVDLLFVGPSDLSQALGVPGDFFHADCVAALDRVAAACRRHGKHWGAVCMNAKHASLMLERGCKMLSPASDVKLVVAGLQAVERDFPEIFRD